MKTKNEFTPVYHNGYRWARMTPCTYSTVDAAKLAAATLAPDDAREVYVVAIDHVELFSEFVDASVEMADKWRISHE